MVRIGDHFMVKYGADIDTIEGENMLFIRQSCNINVPEVYVIFHDERNIHYIIMQYILGQSLMLIWQNLNKDQKLAIIVKLRINLDAMRSISAQGYYDKLGKHLYFDRIFQILEIELQQCIRGSFSNES